MILNSIERALINNPARAAVQRGIEARVLRRLGGRLDGGLALEIGCGQGIGAEIILDQFGAEQVVACDLDPRMVALAQRRLEGRGERAEVREASATQLPWPDESFDAVFDFAIVHHIPDWRTALREVHRVLKPGGRFYAEEVLAAFIDHPLSRRLFDHPMDDRFDAQAFARGMEDAGFAVRGTRRLGGVVGWFVGEKRSR